MIEPTIEKVSTSVNGVQLANIAGIVTRLFAQEEKTLSTTILPGWKVVQIVANGLCMSRWENLQLEGSWDSTETLPVVKSE